jgi:hypothetical protein
MPHAADSLFEFAMLTSDNLLQHEPTPLGVGQSDLIGDGLTEPSHADFPKHSDHFHH